MKQIVVCTPHDIQKYTLKTEHTKKQVETMVIVPSKDITLTSVSLPKLNEKRLMQALPFALEEKLITHTDDLHFAIGTYEKDQTLPVAIVSKHKMQTWLDQLACEQIVPHILIPETYAIPYAQNEWYALLDDHNMSVRTGPSSGFSCDRKNLQTFLQLQLNGTTEKPETLHIYNLSEHSSDLHLESLKINEIRMTKEKLYEQMSEWEINPIINLLQGQYLSKRQFGTNKKIWGFSGIFISLFILFTLISQIISIAILNKGVTTTHTAIYAIYKKHFPNAKSLVAPRERLEAKLKEQNRNANKNDFIMTLADIGKYLVLQNDLTLQSLDYHQNQFYINLKTTHPEALDLLQKNLKNAHFEIHQQKAAFVDQEINANLIISRERYEK